MPSNPFQIEASPRKIKNHHLSRFGRGSGGEIFDYSGAKEGLKASISNRRVAYFFLLAAVVGAVFLGRVFYLQIIRGDYWFQIAEGNRIRVEETLAPRGIIFDREMEPLVKNKPNFVLSFIPAEFINQNSEVEPFLKFLTTEIPEVNVNEVKDEISQAKQYSGEDEEILDNIPYERALSLMMKIKIWPELRLSYFSSRNYVAADYGLSNVLGYLGKIGPEEWPGLKNQGYLLIERVGKTGLERIYEKELRGNPGEKKIEVDVKGNIKKIISESEPKKGANLVLALDGNLNQFLTRRLCAAAVPYGGKAAAVALNPQNGEILALVSCPVFDNNLFSNTKINSEKIEVLLNDAKQPFFNRPIQGEYPAGSVFKLVIAAAGLQEKIITSLTTVLSIGGLKIDQWFFPDWKAGGHGITNVTKAIAESINTFFYYVGGGFDKFSGLGVDKIIEYAKKFHFNQKLGIDLPGEKEGFLPSRDWKFQTKGEEWYIGDTYHLAIGQGDLTVTPLQVAAMTSFFANGGRLYQPHLVKEFLLERGEKQEVKPMILENDIIDQENIEIVRRGMRQAVTSGSAKILLDLPVKAAAKTGTAQVGGNKNPHAWFTSFAPFDNPEIVLTVLIENGVEGSVTAAPVVKDTLQFYFNNKIVK
ncbi:MAG: penicillin-binding protein 2 [Patescibacteria group bacterium]|nr:penicillin-binding protein 2 [Patescibacteria group bacterium]